MSIELTVEDPKQLIFSLPKVDVPPNHFPTPSFTWNLDHNLSLTLDPWHPEEPSDLILVRVEKGRLHSVRIFVPMNLLLASPCPEPLGMTASAPTLDLERHHSRTSHKRYGDQSLHSTDPKRIRGREVGTDTPSDRVAQWGGTTQFHLGHSEVESARSLVSPFPMSSPDEYSLCGDGVTDKARQVLVSELDCPSGSASECSGAKREDCHLGLGRWEKQLRAIDSILDDESRPRSGSNILRLDRGGGSLLHDSLLHAQAALDDILPPATPQPDPTGCLPDDRPGTLSSEMNGEDFFVSNSITTHTSGFPPDRRESLNESTTVPAAVTQTRQLSISDMIRDRKRKDRESTSSTRSRLKTFRTAPSSSVGNPIDAVETRGYASDLIAKYITIASSSDSESADWEENGGLTSDEVDSELEVDGEDQVIDEGSCGVILPISRGRLEHSESQLSQEPQSVGEEYSWAKSKRENPLPQVEKLCAAFDDPAIALQISQRRTKRSTVGLDVGDSKTKVADVAGSDPPPTGRFSEESPVIEILSSEDGDESPCLICNASVANPICPGCAPILDTPPPSNSLDLPRILPYAGPSELTAETGEIDDAGDAGDFFNAEEAEVYAPYEVQGYERIHCAHPAHIVEGATLATAKLPLLTYEPVLPDMCTNRGDNSAISTLQLECVAYCGQRHKVMLPHGGGRAGFFIGDGTGVGKGRQCAAIIADNWARGRERAVWCSASAQLAKDAKRDLHDIGCRRSNRKFDIPIINMKSDVKAGQLIRQKKGLVFVTYSLLAGGKKGPAKNRLEQLVEWLDPGGDGSFDGPIIFDEGHKAKHLTRSEKTSSQTALNVIELQKLLPRARIVYVSATGASQPEDMGYMVRLGLWGEGTSFPTFQNFVDTISNAGIGAIEIVALTMKEMGMYFSRHIAFTDAEFEMDEFQLSKEQIVQYNAASRLWDKILRQIQHMLSQSQVDERWKTLSKVVWGIHQRFWLEYLVALKVDACARLARDKLESGYAVVIGLQSTGGMALEYAIERKLRESEAGGRISKPLTFESHVSTQKESIFLLLRKHWDPLDAEFIAEVQEEVEALHLPPSPLDSLIDRLGGYKDVAELTGRNKRLERLPRGDGKWVVRKRNASRENDEEKEKFMKGQKLIAVISEAASTGISLHSSVECKNQRRRYHIILQLPWSAQKAVQQLGRTHRSHQASAPHYHLLCSKLGGEWRLASAVAARLASLGALTSGDRRGGAAVESLSQYLLEPKCGAHAAKECLKTFKRTGQPIKLEVHDIYSAEQAHAEEIERLAVLQMYSKVMVSKGAQTAKLFLNRLLGLEVELQEHLFESFKNSYEEALMDRSRSGKVGTAVYEIEGELELGTDDELPVVYTTPDKPAEKLHLITLSVDRGVPFSKAHRMLADMKTKPGRNSKYNGFYLSRRGIVVLALQQMRGSSRFQITKPHLGCESAPINLSSLRSRFNLVENIATAREMWERKYAETYRPGRGHRIAHQFVLTGSLHLIFAKVVEIYSRRTDRKPQVVRAIWSSQSGEERRVVGLQIDRTHVVQILRDLQEGEQNCIVDARRSTLVLKVKEQITTLGEHAEDKILKLLGDIPSQRLKRFLSDQDSKESADDMASFVAEFIRVGRARALEAFKIIQSSGYDHILSQQWANYILYKMPPDMSAMAVAKRVILMHRGQILRQAILEHRNFCEDSFIRVPCCQDYCQSRRHDIHRVVLEYTEAMRQEHERALAIRKQGGMYRRQSLGLNLLKSDFFGGSLSGGIAMSAPVQGNTFSDQTAYRRAATNAFSSPALLSLATSSGMKRAQALAQPNRRSLAGSIGPTGLERTGQISITQDAVGSAKAADSLAAEGTPGHTSAGPALPSDVIVLYDSPPLE